MKAQIITAAGVRTASASRGRARCGSQRLCTRKAAWPPGTGAASSFAAAWAHSWCDKGVRPQREKVVRLLGRSGCTHARQPESPDGGAERGVGHRAVGPAAACTAATPHPRRSGGAAHGALRRRRRGNAAALLPRRRLGVSHGESP